MKHMEKKLEEMREVLQPPYNRDPIYGEDPHEAWAKDMEGGMKGCLGCMGYSIALLGGTFVLYTLFSS